MALAYVGALSLAALVPSVALSIGGVAVTANADLSGNLAISASLSASPPTIQTTISGLVSAQADFQVAISAFPPVPSISFQLSDTVALSVGVGVSLNLLLALELLLGANAGIYSYGYSGVGNALGSAISTALASTFPDGSPTSATCTAFVFVAATVGGSAQMARFLALPFSAGLSYGGKLGLTALSPVTASATAQGATKLQAKAKVAAQLQAKASVGVQALPLQLVGQVKSFAQLTAQAAAGIQMPKISAAAAASAKVAADLQANFSALCSLGLALQATGEVLFVYTYAGPANGLGAALSAVTGTTWGDGVTPTSGGCTASLLVATDPLSASTMAAFFGGA